MSSTPIFYPDRIPEAIRANPRRTAECVVFDALKEQVCGPWHVYYSRPWLGLDKYGVDKEGEADFVLAHPELGMLVLEVKGGGIQYDAVRDRWTTKNAEQDTLRIKNPAIQATTNKHELLRMLKQAPRWYNRYINARIGVVFPQCRVPSTLAPNLPRRAIADVTDLPSIGRWVAKRMHDVDFDTPATLDELGQDGIEILDAFFASSFRLERPMAATLLQADTELRLLTERQSLILQLLEPHTRLAIPGAAGTAKTSLAVEKSLRLARQGKRTLLLCFNRPLAVQLRLQIGAVPNLQISSFKAFASSIARAAGLPIPASVSEDSRTDGRWASLLAAARALPGERFDAIIVDEGQDLDEGWMIGVESLLRDTMASVFYVSYDDNQKVHGCISASIEGTVRRSDIHLNRILRNTRPIAESFRFLLPNEIGIDGPDGPAAQFRAVRRLDVSELAALIAELVTVHAIAPESIAVLFQDSAAMERFGIGGNLVEWRTGNAEEQPNGQIVCDTVRRFKGLERSVVILVNPSSYWLEPEMLYVAMSRARTLRILVDEQAGLISVMAALEIEDPDARAGLIEPCV